MAASIDCAVVADPVTCVISDDKFEIRFSRGYRALHLAVNVFLVFLSGFLALTLFAAFRLQIAFDNWWGWLPLAFCSFAAIMHRFFTQGFTRAPVRIDLAGRVQCGYQRVRFRTPPTVCVTVPASHTGTFVDKATLRGKSSVVLVGAGGTRVVVFKARRGTRVLYVAESLAAWLGQSGCQALRPNGGARLARCVTIMCVVDVLASLYTGWADHQIFHPVHMGTFALVFTAALTSALLLICMTRLGRRWRDRNVMVEVKDRVVQSVVVLLKVAVVSTTLFHFSNLVELRSTPMQPRTSRTIIESVGKPGKDCGSLLFFIEPRLGRLAMFCPVNDGQKWVVGQSVLLDERVNAFGVRVVGVSDVPAVAGDERGDTERQALGRCGWRE
jgi:hypothetical protein